MSNYSSQAVVPTVEKNGQLYIKLNDGHKMPMVGLGTWQSEEAVCRRAIRDAVLAGYRHIDTAHWYANEDAIGAELQALFKEGIVKRQDLFITTKLHPAFMGRDDVIPQLKVQLDKLKLDYVDLFLVHWPFAYVNDGTLFPIDPATNKVRIDNSKHYTETWKSMEDVHRLGLAKSIGISNFNICQVEDILLRANIRPVVLQIESHPYFANATLIQYCQLRNIAITAYSPLANPGNGWVARDAAGYPKPMQDETLKKIAAKYPGKTVAHVMLRWQTQRGVAVIPKSVSAERLKANLNIFDFKLSPEDVEAIDALDRGTRMCPFVDCGNSSARDYPFEDYRDVSNPFQA